MPLMNTVTNSHDNSFQSTSPVTGWLILAMCFALICAVASHYVVPPDAYQNNQLKMELEKSSGRNGQHANQKAREKAQQEYEKVRGEYQQWNSKPNKTPDDKKFIEKLRKLLERLRKKKDFNGENHSQKHKGN